MQRIARLIRTQVGAFGLDLSGLTVLTEVGTNYFALTPIIAAMAGADVLAVTPPDAGERERAISEMMAYVRGVSPPGVISLYRREHVPWGQADIVTNLGHVRPIDKEAIGELSGRVVVSLMAEWWEIRDRDVDIGALRDAGIPVLATNEHALGIWDYLGWLALKMLFDEGVEGRKSVVAIVGDGEFATVLSRGLRKFGVTVVETASRYVDAVILADYLGQKDFTPPPGVAFIPFAFNERMHRTLAYLGPRPLIELHTAGLAVGGALARTGLRGREAEREAMEECFFAQDETSG